MPDGTGEEYGAPSLSTLKQMSWDIGYIRDKLTLGNVSKTLIWQKAGMAHQMVLGRIVVRSGNLLGAFRAMANAISAQEDGPAPAVEGFGQSNWSQAQLMAMHDGLVVIAAKIFASKRTFTMRMSALAGSNVELAIGDIVASHASYRSAVAALSDQVSEGAG